MALVGIVISVASDIMATNSPSPRATPSDSVFLLKNNRMIIIIISTYIKQHAQKCN